MEVQHYTIPQVARLLNTGYHRVYWAVVAGRVDHQRVGHTRLLTADAVARLREHFGNTDRTGRGSV